MTHLCRKGYAGKVFKKRLRCCSLAVHFVTLALRLNLAYAKVCPKIKFSFAKYVRFLNESSTWRLLVHIKQLFKPILGNYRKCMVVHFTYFYKQPGRCLKTEDWGFLERVTHDFFLFFIWTQERTHYRKEPTNSRSSISRTFIQVIEFKNIII